MYCKTKTLGLVTANIMLFAVIFTANLASPKSFLTVTWEAFLYSNHAHTYIILTTARAALHLVGNLQYITCLLLL